MHQHDHFDPEPIVIAFNSMIEDLKKAKLYPGENHHSHISQWYYDRPILDTKHRESFRAVFSNYLIRYFDVLENRFANEYYPGASFDFKIFKTMRATLMEISDSILSGLPPYAQYLGKAYGDTVNPHCIKLVWCVAASDKSEIKISWRAQVIPGVGNTSEVIIKELYQGKLATGNKASRG